MIKPTQKKSTLAPAAKKASASEITRTKKPAVQPDVRKTIAENLKAWMRADPNLDTQPKVAAASKVGQTTVSRILLGTTPATVDVLAAIAKAFRRNPGELFVDHRAPKVQYDLEKFARLPDYERVRIEAFIKHVLTEAEPAPSAGSRSKTPR
jgi:transcriptional regulator with XRE-family HTH domain